VRRLFRRPWPGRRRTCPRDILWDRFAGVELEVTSMILPVDHSQAVEGFFRPLTLSGVKFLPQPGCGRTFEHQCPDGDRLEAKLAPLPSALPWLDREPANDSAQRACAAGRMPAGRNCRVGASRQKSDLEVSRRPSQSRLSAQPKTFGHLNCSGGLDT